jgi:transposase
VKQINEEADTGENTLRISMDTKAPVKVGPFARGGKSRVLTKATDHDFQPEATVTPVGIFLPATDEFFLYGVTSKVTSDCLVDQLVDWWETVKDRFSQVKMLVINIDNGPENHSRRTQFMQRLLEFARRYQVTVRLAYYPPYHSKYNPVERCWGILERHWLRHEVVYVAVGTDETGPNPVFHHRYFTENCVRSNAGVGSSQDNVPSLR